MDCCGVFKVVFLHDYVGDGDSDDIYYLRCYRVCSPLRSGRDSEAVLFRLSCKSCPYGFRGPWGFKRKGKISGFAVMCMARGWRRSLRPPAAQLARQACECPVSSTCGFARFLSREAGCFLYGAIPTSQCCPRFITKQTPPNRTSPQPNVYEVAKEGRSRKHLGVTRLGPFVTFMEL